MQTFLLSHPDEEPMDFTSLEMDSFALSPVTPDSMNLQDLKWPSLESLELSVSGSQSPCPVDLALPNPPTPETVYECSCEASVQEPPLPELLDTIYLQPATPEPESRTESDISNPASPEPHFPTCQKPAAHELDTQALVLWSKKETFMGCAEEGGAMNIPESYFEEDIGQIVYSSTPIINFPIQPDTVDSAPLESETLFSAILCSVESDSLDPEVTSIDEPMSQELNPPGLATIDPATVHPFNLSLLELQSALDVSKSETSDNGSPRGTAAISSPSHSPSARDFLWIRWQRKARGRQLLSRSARIQFHLPSSGSVDRPSQQPPAVTYTPSTPTYKRTPPPVPPRSTSKPLISITAQSSTESTQDAYHEGQLARGGIWGSDGVSLSLGRALYNSTDSLDSAKAVTIAMEAAAMAMAGKRHPSTDSHSSVMTCDKAVLVSKAEEYLKTPRSSIGIQVEAATDSECESKGSREYHSVGIQVEDERRQGRFKRSNSVTAAVQADLELEGFPLMEDKGLQFGGGFQRHSEPSTPTQYGAVRTVRTQGLFSYREDYRTPTEPSSPQRSPEPWLEPSPREPIATVAVTVTPPQPTDSGRASPSCRRDGSWFMQLLHTETKKMEGWCKELEGEAEENDLSEEILGKIRSAVGSAQLLMSQKFQQFYWLCQQNLDPSAMPRPTSQDLAGFWDLLQLSIDDVTSKFNELQKIKSNDWRLIESPVKKLPPPVPKKTLRKSVTREKSLDLPDRQRQEARRRLMAAKRAASFRQNSASERADSIEIYIPEAQTRL
uniref:DLG associated protein 2 n=1 Tax=Cyprinus carpio carpio TaxID=630221 RepID=A0A9J7ZDJ8_CYPCA